MMNQKILPLYYNINLFL